MVLETSGDTADFKTTVKSLSSTDVVKISEETTSMANKAALFTDEKTLASVAVAEALPAHTIPSGYTLIVLAKPNNTDEIYYGHSKAEAETKKHALKAGDSISLKITNSNLIFILPKVTNEGVDLFAESD